MSADVHQMPLSIDAQADAWDAWDKARLALEALYADPNSKRDDRLVASMETARLWKRWQALFLRNVA